MKSVLVTGCSTGIGHCIATQLSQHNYHVLATVRNSADKAKLEGEGLSACQLDLADSASIKKAAGWAMEQSNNRLYALVNNGAYGQPGAVEDLTREALIEQFQVNVFGTQELTNLILAGMRKHNEGKIIQISSILGLICLPYRGAYNASKYALEALTDTMRLELLKTNIKVSLIEPGPIESDFRKNALAMFFKHINQQQSAHQQYYASVTDRLEAIENVPFTLPAEAVFKKVLHALESANPKIRYKVTIPAVALSYLKRVLPDRMFDSLIARKLG